MSKITRLTGDATEEANGQRLHFRELPEDREPPTETVGQELRGARLRRGDELSRVSQALRIRKDYLDAIEADAPDKLPGRAYGIGFVRSYAEYLGLNPKELVERYKKAAGDSPGNAHWVGPPPEPARLRVPGATTVLVLVVAGLLGYGVYQIWRSPPADTRSSTSNSAQPVAAHRATAPGRNSPAAPARPQQQPGIALPANGLPAGTSGQAAMISQLPANSSGQVFGALNRDARLLLQAHALTHVLVQGPDGTVYINRLLHPGDVYRVPNLVGLSLTTPDGGAVFLQLDGQDMGAAGKTGHITEALSLDPRAIVERRIAGGSGGNRVTQ